MGKTKKLTATQRAKAKSKHQPTGRWIRIDKRLAIYLRDSFLCLACTRDLHGADPQDVTLDHIIPKSDGGSNDESNLFTCCRSCNCTRQDKPLNRFVGREAMAHIRRNTRRSLTRFRTLARAILADEVGMEQAIKETR